MQVLELEGLKFTAVAGGLGLRTPGNRPPYGLSWLAVEKLHEWLTLSIDKHRAPVDPAIARNLQGWKPHPTSPGYYYKGEDVRSYSQLADECRGLSPEALTAAVWDGEGLPPVGCECACGPHANSSALLVVGFDELGPVGRWINGPDKGKYFSAGQYQLSPLRTAEQLAAEAREAEILKIAHAVGLGGQPYVAALDLIAKLYDLGVRLPNA